MKVKTILLLLLTLFPAASRLSAQERDTVQTELSESNYFGADLTQFPPKARKWIMTGTFAPEKMTKPFMLNSKLKVWWAEDGNALLFEASYTIAPGYKKAGSVTVWGEKAKYSGDAIIYQRYGEFAKYHTLRFKWEYARYCQALMEKDTLYAQVAAFAKQLCEELEYDWTHFNAYLGIPAKGTPGKKHCICDGYTDEVMERILQLDCVASVQKWTSGNHAWNVLTLTDGRTLYCDLTWFDNEYINRKTGSVEQQEDYNWKNLTFDPEVFKYSNVSFPKEVFEHLSGKMVAEKRRE